MLTGCTSLSKEAPRQQDEVLYQVSTIDALLSGDYDGTYTCGELRQHGDFGIGTFNALDGEMLQLDGAIFKIRSDGKAYRMPDSTRTPFASVTHFEADTVIELTRPLSFEQLCTYIDSLIPTENIFYAIKVEGEFEYLKARSVPQQSKPYLPLVEVVKTQPIFEFKNETGTLVGFRTPPYMKGLNVPGYHLHFLSSDQTRGGHVLTCTLGKVKLSIDNTSAFHMELPATSTFQRVDLTQDKQDELEKVEK
ncbi:alpha-acetolactate decarboxylase [Telluribacter humicola]